ncbi:hypothetical protein CHS0354_002409 [Potamilus streckersoni]|uniref:CARD domain-containing protein n=1 Tax=Potamilus streckersoni TaxID=2493646 RepID=A0AAE0T8K6_9BIVA|nr:hypothetical protein CHS0354_002409 [Potamilus streckersoni]
MDPKDKRSLCKSQVAIVADLEPKDVLEYLLEDGVLTENDVELISNGKTRRERCQLLLSMLPKRGPSAYGSFRKALRAENLYPNLDEILSAGKRDFQDTMHRTKIHDNEETEVKSEDILSDDEETDFKSVAEVRRVCDKCISFIPQMDEDSEFWNLCRKYCCLLLDNIEPVDIYDLHFQEQILGDDDFERIRGGSTRKERCKIMLQLLADSQNERVVPVFKKSLKKKYTYILDVIDKNAVETNQTSSCMHVQEIMDGSPIEKQRSLAQSSANSTKTTSERESEIKHNQIDGAVPILTSRESETEYNQIDGAVPILTSRESETEYNQIDGAVPILTSRLQGELRSHNGVKDRQKGYAHVMMALSSDSDIDEHVPKSRKKLRKTQKGNKVDTACNYQNTVVPDQSETKVSSILTIHPGAVAPFHLPNKRLIVTFNFLSTMINQGNFEKFESLSSDLRKKYHREPDMQCLLGYLHASRDLFRTDFESAKKHINSSLEIAPKTSNPKYFTLELFTAKTRMYITQKKLEKLQETLDDAKMMIETDPVGCTGRAAGWLYMNDARNLTAQIAMLNFRKEQSFHTYTWLHEKAKTSFQKALTNFQQDGGKDGPFGFGYALCRLVILLLRCGDNGLTMNVLSPPKEDVKRASELLEQLENSQIAIPKILEVHYLLAKSDYQFRRGNTVRALEHAQSACNLSTELNMREFTEHAHNRLVFLKTKNSLIIEEVDEEEINQILLGESSDTDLKSE